MSLLVFLLLARPGGGTGGAEASPRRGVEKTPGAGRGVEKTQSEAQMQLHNELSDAKKLSGNGGGEAWATGPIRRRAARKHPARPRPQRL